MLGCPVEIRPIDDEDSDGARKAEPVTAKRVYKRAFEELFPGQPVPETIGVTCCSQFAVRRETIWQRPRSDYVRYREWLMSSSLADDLSGRVLEYSWHSMRPPSQHLHPICFFFVALPLTELVIFGKDPVHCPSAGECYCQTYGLCGMECDKAGCSGQYTLPPFSTLPQGWPKIGWDNEDRGWDGLP